MQGNIYQCSLYCMVHAGVWSGFAMHPLEQIVYLSRAFLPLLFAHHPVHFIYMVRPLIPNYAVALLAKYCYVFLAPLVHHCSAGQSGDAVTCDLASRLLCTRCVLLPAVLTDIPFSTEMQLVLVATANDFKQHLVIWQLFRALFAAANGARWLALALHPSCEVQLVP